MAVLKVSASVAAGYLLAPDDNVHGAQKSVMANNAVVGGIKRIGAAAQQAEAALHRVDTMADHASNVMTEVSELVGVAEPMFRDLDETLAMARAELAGLTTIRANVDEVFARVDQILGLIEFFLTPAFVARRKIEELCETLDWIRSGLRRPKRQTPPQPQRVARLIPITENRLAG